MIKFIHTSDWQLGMTRRFLREGEHERYTASRFEAIHRIAQIAREENCAFVAVAGDVFEANQVGRKTIVRALEALRAVPVPVYLLPGNHDPLTHASVFTAPVFTDNRPQNVHVIADDRPIPVADGAELIGAPWTAKRLAVNPLHEILPALPTADGTLRICLAHGPVDTAGDFPDSAAMLHVAQLRRALDDGRIHYVALGDKHSYLHVDGDRRIAYSGTPEATAFREPDPGYINLVELDASGALSRKVATGAWRFAEIEAELNGPEDADAFFRQLDEMPRKDHAILRLRLSGLVDLTTAGMVQKSLVHFEDLFASLEVRSNRLHTSVGENDPVFDRFSGFAAETVKNLREAVNHGGPEAETARDALLLFLRLAPAGAREDRT